MAAIDKTYVHDYDTWKELYDYAGEAAPFGEKGFLRNFCYGPYAKEEFPSEYGVVLWNTPTYVDVWLAENCKHEVVVETLKYQYGNEEYAEMASGEYRRKREAEEIRYYEARLKDCYPEGEVYFTISKGMSNHQCMSRGSYSVSIKDDKTGEDWLFNEGYDIPGPIADSSTGYEYYRRGGYCNQPENWRYKRSVITYHGRKIVYHKYYPHQFNKHFIYNILRNCRLRPGLTITITFDAWKYKNMVKYDKNGEMDNTVWREVVVVHTKKRRVRHKVKKH